MIDVILYGQDHRGRLTASERWFRSFPELVRFFNSPESFPWAWAEVKHIDPGGRSRHVRYPAEELRSMSVTSRLQPSPN